MHIQTIDMTTIDPQAGKSSLVFPGITLDERERRLIDTVRGLLCLSIFLFHWHSSYGLQLSGVPTWIHKLFHQGYVVVDIFFALSGFLIANSVENIIATDGSISWMCYFKKRFFRIFPSWSVALLLYWLYNGRLNLAEYFSNLFFTFALKPFNFSELLALHSWSLFAEIVFYVCFPIFIISWQRGFFPYLLLLFFLTYGLSYRIDQVPPGTMYITPYNTFSFFFTGAGVYWLWPTFRSLNPRPWFFIIFATTLFMLSISDLPKKSLTYLYIFFYFIVIAKLPLIWIKPLTTFLVPMGRICYSFYLMHILAIWLAPRVLQSAYSPPKDYSNHLVFLTAALLAIVFGSALYRFVERPMIEFAKNS